MQFKTIFLPLSLTFALAACPGSESADPAQLIQQGQYDAAIEAAEGQLQTVEAGSAEHESSSSTPRPSRRAALTSPATPS